MPRATRSHSSIAAARADAVPSPQRQQGRPLLALRAETHFVAERTAWTVPPGIPTLHSVVLARREGFASLLGKIHAMTTKYVYFFGGGKADGKADMKNLLGGKGANLAEMANLGLPV